MNKNKIISLLYMPKTRRLIKLFKRSKKKKVNVCAELYPCWNEYLIEDLKAAPCRKTENFTRKIRYRKDKVHFKDYDVFRCRGKEPDGKCDDGYTTCEDESDLARYEEYYLKNSKDLNKFKLILQDKIVEYFLSKAGDVVDTEEEDRYLDKGRHMLKRLNEHSLDLEDIDLFNIITKYITKDPLNELRLLILSENFKPKKKKGQDNALATSVTRSVKRERTSRTSKKSSNSNSNSKKIRRARRSSYSNALTNYRVK